MLLQFFVKRCRVYISSVKVDTALMILLLDSYMPNTTSIYDMNLTQLSCILAQKNSPIPYKVQQQWLSFSRNYLLMQPKPRNMSTCSPFPLHTSSKPLLLMFSSMTVHIKILLSWARSRYRTWRACAANSKHSIQENKTKTYKLDNVVGPSVQFLHHSSQQYPKIPS